VSDPAVEAIAAKVRVALEAADLEQFADLLDPRVTWGAPGDPRPRAKPDSRFLPGTRTDAPQDVAITSAA
jgi:hypothetical protein